MRTRHIILSVTIITALAVVSPRAYVVHGPKWPTAQVPYYVNPANNDGLSASAVISAIQTGASGWSAQSNADISYYYMGQTSGSSLQNNGKNEIFFRNEADGGVIAVTYWWYNSSNQLVDADVKFYDGGWTFFTGTSGCSSGAYIEDIAAHELGHALGLAHTSVSGATMYPSYSRCSTSFRTLDPDDLAGVEFLYPSSGTSSNASPSVAISSPSSNATFTQGSTETLSGSASDAEDGTLSSRISWASNLDGRLGTGSSLSTILSAGTHTITATVTDSAGATSAAQRSVTVTASTTSTSSIKLSAKGSKVKGRQRATLQWSGASATKVDIYRNGARIMTTANDGSQTDAINQRGSGQYTYLVCNTGTTTCSNAATIVF